MIGNEELSSTAENYRRFARYEAKGRSALYEALSEGVADDPEVLSLLRSLPFPKRQPNLLFAAVRYLHETLPDYGTFRSTLLNDWGRISSTMVARRTQTNEIGRCATLLPLLSSLPQPLALFEVGASAGLCLLIDRYRYDLGAGPFGPVNSPVLLRCELRGTNRRPPGNVPEVVWRAGCDLDPVDLRNEESVRWLEALIWPGEGDRLTRLRSAVEIARNEPAPIFRRDLRHGITDLVRDVPDGATLVVFHSAVLAYVAPTDRESFTREVERVGARWISNEGPGVVASLDSMINHGERHRGDFLLSLDGRAVGWADPHGQWVSLSSSLDVTETSP